MRFEKLDLNLLVALDILLEEKNITKSADKLHLSQSATSNILSRLRDYFEDDILVQEGRNMQPTPYALELRAPITEMLNIVKGSITSKRQSDPKHSERHFRIIASDYIIQVVLLPLIREVLIEAPNITFEFLTIFSHDAQSILKGGADLYIAPEVHMHEAYPSMFLFSDELVFIADQNNEGVGDNLQIEDILKFSHASIGSQRITQITTEQWYPRNMLAERRIDVITNDFSSLCESVVGSNRLATIPKRFAELKAKNLPLKLLSFPHDIPLLKEHMMWHPTHQNDPIHRWLRNKIVQHTSILGHDDLTDV